MRRALQYNARFAPESDMKQKRFIVYAVLLAVVLGTSWWVRFGRPGPAADRVAVPAAQAREGGEYLRATHWFGDGWAVNLWNTALLAQARQDFPAIRADGFNTVVLVVPWPGFAQARTDGRLNPDRVRRLRALMDLADDHDLDVILRLGYAWDSSVKAPGQWLGELWYDDAVYGAWLDHLAAIWDAVGDHPRLAFGFLTWEDLWAVTWLGGAPEKRRLARAGLLGYTAWLQASMSLEEVSEAYGRRFSDWSEVPAPERERPEYALFLAFMDDAWINRFFTPAKARFPQLSMEIRIDSDPVYGEDGEIIDWFAHEASWDLPGADWITMYWSPAMGGLNRGERLAPETAAERLQYMLERVRNATGNRRIFIDQFLVEDYTPGYDNNGRLAPDDIPRFLEHAAPVLQGYAQGYALWSWKDYIHNAVPSPDFSQPDLGWTVPDGATTSPDSSTPGASSPVPGLALAAGQAIERSFRQPNFHAPGGPESATFCVTAMAIDGAPADLALTTPGQDVPTARLPANGTPQCMDLAIEWTTEVRLVATEDLVIEEMTFSGFTQPIGIRDLHGNPKPVASAWAKMNDKLDRTRTVPFGLLGDAWMGRVLDAEPLWAGEGEVPHVVIETSLPENWPFIPRITVRADEKALGTIDCGHPGENRMKLPEEVDEDGLRLTLVADRTWSPPGDQRRLGCQVKRVHIDLDSP